MPYGTQYGRIAIVGIVVTLGFMMLATSAFAPPSNDSIIDPRVFPPSSTPFGMFYGEWAAEWWQWNLTIPASENPIPDMTGEKCAVGQRGPVWFLVGAGLSGIVTRHCSVPEGTALFFPIINLFTASDPPPLPPTGLGALRNFAKAFIDDVTDLLVEVDGVSIRNLDLFRFTSPVFVLTVLPDNTFQATPGPYFPTVDEGFYVMLKPLPVGEHTLRIHGAAPSFALVLDVTYHLTVVPLRLP